MARKAHGTTLTWGGSAQTSLYITNLSFSGMTKPTTDVSHFASDWAEHISTGTVDGGELSFDIIFDAGSANYATMMTDFQAGTAKTALITYNGSPASTVSGSAVITQLGVGSGGMADALTCSCTLKFTGTVTIV